MAGVGPMAAILRTGKFLRLFSGVARNLAATSGKNEETGLVPTTGLCFDGNFLSQANFSIQNVLPYLGVSDSGHAEDRYPTRLLSTPNRNLGRVTRPEIEAMIEEIRASEVNQANLNLLSSQALLAIRLCGTVLDQEAQVDRSRLVAGIWDLLLEKSLPVTVVHYNALLRVHLENRFSFDPKSIISEMKKRGVDPDRETYQCLISRYCQLGNIDGASKILQTMKKMGFKVNENIFNSLIIGHSENGDMARSAGILKVMRQCGLSPSTETYLTLACAFAKHGDVAAMNKIIVEAASADMAFKDGDYLELLFVLCENDHKDQVGSMLAALHPETEEFGCLASHLVVRLVNAGHDDVAYNLVQFTVENSCEESGRLISAEYLEQLVRVNTTVSKLLWLLKDMSDRKIHTGGLESIMDVAMKNRNLGLAMRLAEITMSEGGKVSKKQFKSMLSLTRKLANATRDVAEAGVLEHVFSCVRIGAASGHMTPDILKKWIFPLVDTWPELTVAQLEEAGLPRDKTVTPMIEYLVGRGETEAAATVAGIFSEHVDPKLKFMTSAASGVQAACNHFAGDIKPDSMPAKVGVSDKKSEDQTVITLANQLLADDRIGDLELMLETRETPSDREVIYTNLVKLYAKHNSIDRAINLSRRLREEHLNTPHFYEVLGELIESQYHGDQQQQEVPAPLHPIPHQYYNQMIQLPPAPPGMHYVSPDPNYPNGGGAPQYFYPVFPGGFYPQQQQQEAAAADAAYPPDTPELSVTSETPTLVSLGGESYYSTGAEHGYLHRQLKRSIAEGNASKALNIYTGLESLGKVINVTETSALIEQLVRADMARDATEITKNMLMRNTHPLPKIFRFLLNKLATTGAVDDINAIGQFLSTKIKKDVSYDNRLCNAYLSAGRGAEFLDILVADLDMATANGDTQMMSLIQDRFPRGGAMGLLDNHPELLDKFTVLAEGFAKTGYVAPMNVLWTYHFINENTATADSIWENYVKGSNQIMFQKVCQVARSTGNLSLAFGLVNKLADADQVTRGARGIAYSCLLDCLCSKEDHQQGWTVLQDALSRGVELEDVNRTALIRLKSGLEAEGQPFPYTIPPKNVKRGGEPERSLSPVDWNDM